MIELGALDGEDMGTYIGHMRSATLTLTLSAEGNYLVTASGLIEREWLDLFGTATLPTPYTTRTPRHVVAAEIAKRNPDCEVRS